MARISLKSVPGSVIGVLVSLGVSLMISLVFGGGKDLCSTLLGGIGILTICFSFFSGWGHTMIGNVPNLGVMDLQHRDPSLVGRIDIGWMITGALDLLLALTIAYL